MKAILFKKQHHANILSGEKNWTMRDGHRDYSVGEKIILCCHIDVFVVMATVVAVSYTTIENLAEDDCKNFGFKDTTEVLLYMKRFYPGIQPDSEITIMIWDKIEGSFKTAYDQCFSAK